MEQLPRRPGKGGTNQEEVFVESIHSPQPSRQLLHASPKAPTVGALPPTSMSASRWERGFNRPEGRSIRLLAVTRSHRLWPVEYSPESALSRETSKVAIF
jgi:hypothetical protein